MREDERQHLEASARKPAASKQSDEAGEIARLRAERLKKKEQPRAKKLVIKPKGVAVNDLFSKVELKKAEAAISMQGANAGSKLSRRSPSSLSSDSGGARARMKRKKTDTSQEQLAHLQQMVEGFQKMQAEIKSLRYKVRVRDEVDADGSQDRSEDEAPGEDSDSEEQKSTASAQAVTYREFQRQAKQLAELRRGVATLRTQLGDLQRGGVGHVDFLEPGPAGGDETDGAMAFRRNLLELEQQTKERLEHIELLKQEMKVELKRLQRQNFAVNKEFEKQAVRCKWAVTRVAEFEQKILLTDSSMATLFKLVRI